MHTSTAHANVCNCNHGEGEVCQCDHEDDRTLREKVQPYTRLIIVVVIITLIAIGAAFYSNTGWHGFMQYLMGGYFFGFGLLQLISLKKSAKMLQAYDPIASRVPVYGYIFPFIQLLLGAAYFTWVVPAVVNLVALAFLLVNTTGVYKVIESKKVVRCGCLGTTLNVPVSKVTLWENLIMVGMAFSMLTFALISLVPGINIPSIDHSNHSIFYRQ